MNPATIGTSAGSMGESVRAQIVRMPIGNAPTAQELEDPGVAVARIRMETNGG